MDPAAIAREPLPPMRACGGRPVTKATAVLPMVVGSWTHTYWPLKKGFRPGHRCLRRDAGMKGVT